MITAIIFLLVGTLFNILGGILSLIPLEVPQQFTDALSYALSKVAVFQGIFVVDQLMLALVALLSAWVLVYTVRVVLHFFGFFPGVTSQGLPSKKDTKDT